MPYVYALDQKHRQPPMEMKDLLGGKGANLAEMTSVLGLPVPPGFTITTDACRAYLGDGWPDSLGAEVAQAAWRGAGWARAVRRVEKTMGKRLGDPADPLLVSVRSGAKFSMPGMMDTVLNLGLNEETLQGLIALTGNERSGWYASRRSGAMFGRIVMGVDAKRFDEPLESKKKARGAAAGHAPDATALARGRRRSTRGQ